VRCSLWAGMPNWWECFHAPLQSAPGPSLGVAALVESSDDPRVVLLWVLLPSTSGSRTGGDSGPLLWGCLLAVVVQSPSVLRPHEGDEHRPLGVWTCEVHAVQHWSV